MKRRRAPSRARAIAAKGIFRHLVVAGDVLNDRHLYTGKRNTPATRDSRGVKMVSQHGGAHLLHGLIERVLKTSDALVGWKALLGVHPPPLCAEPRGYVGYAIWQPFPQRKKLPRENTQDKVPEVWRAVRLKDYADATTGDFAGRLMGYDDLTAGEVHGLAAPGPRAVPNPDVLILDDGGFLFRQEAGRPSWGLAERTSGFVLLKMSEPVAQGPLWHFLHGQCADRLVCLVSARDLRREKLSLGRGLSWEATVDDLRTALHDDPAAQQLAEARHLIVTFSGDGALWLDRTNLSEPRAHLCFDAIRAEGEWEVQFPGDAFGYHCAMAAALAVGLARHAEEKQKDSKASLNLIPAIEAGLLAMRDLKENGHGPVREILPDGYPLDRIAAKIHYAYDAYDERDAPEDFARTVIAWPENLAPEGTGDVSLHWKLLAPQVARAGVKLLKGLPRAQFGRLLTVDPGEIETLRHIRQRMRAYSDSAAPKRPLSIGVFGPPGAGKSFGVEQLAAEVLGEKSWRVFNLSQFRDSGDLNGAFHQIRDLTLGGLTPVVLWDEFDSRALDWLQYLLAPMQDGRFQDGQLNHAIGKCVFIYAGGTYWSYAEFANPRDDMKGDFGRLKGPDFVSRLDAYMDVLGPNQRTLAPPSAAGWELDRQLDDKDVSYPLRRALLIRAYLGCKPDQKVDFDPYLLHALLGVSRYRHGARSLEKLINLLGETDKQKVRRSDLPRPEQLEMHVDAREFAQFMQEEEVAATIHETWRELSRKEGWRMAPRFDKPYADLSEEDKEDNRAAARRISKVLELAGLGLRRAGEGSEPAVADKDVRATLRQDIERLAEVEHNGWMQHRQLLGWRYGPKRDDDARVHPALKPYAELSDDDKEKDRNSVMHYPDFVARGKQRIVRLKPDGQGKEKPRSGRRWTSAKKKRPARKRRLGRGRPK